MGCACAAWTAIGEEHSILGDLSLLHLVCRGAFTPATHGDHAGRRIIGTYNRMGRRVSLFPVSRASRKGVSASQGLLVRCLDWAGEGRRRCELGALPAVDFHPSPDS